MHAAGWLRPVRTVVCNGAAWRAEVSPRQVGPVGTRYTLCLFPYRDGARQGLQLDIYAAAVLQGDPLSAFRVRVKAAVAVEIGGEGEHRVRRRLLELLRDGLGEGVARLEVGAGIPERAGDDIHLTVAVDVGGVHAVAPGFGSEGDFFERDQ